MCNCGVCMIYKKVKMAQCLWALKMWSFTEKNPNVFIFKEFFYILAYICVYNFVLVCVKICASWKIDCSVQRERCFSLPTIAQEDASIQFPIFCLNSIGKNDISNSYLSLQTNIKNVGKTPNPTLLWGSAAWDDDGLQPPTAWAYDSLQCCLEWCPPYAHHMLLVTAFSAAWNAAH